MFAMICFCLILANAIINFIIGTTFTHYWIVTIAALVGVGSLWMYNTALEKVIQYIVSKNYNGKYEALLEEVAKSEE